MFLKLSNIQLELILLASTLLLVGPNGATEAPGYDDHQIEKPELELRQANEPSIDRGESELSKEQIDKPFELVYDPDQGTSGEMMTVKISAHATSDDELDPDFDSEHQIFGSKLGVDLRVKKFANRGNNN